MFGYIVPFKPELKLKEINKYSATYCSLCDQMSRDYGLLSRSVLNYDITFLLIYLNSITKQDVERKIVCPMNLLKRKKVLVSEQALEYAAFINYWLVTEKLYDDYVDNGNILTKFVWKLMTKSKNYRMRKQQYLPHIENLEKMLKNVYSAEQEIHDALGFDIVTNEFGRFFAALFMEESFHTDSSEKSAKARDVFFQVGKWIYIMDAFDDLNGDIRKKRFNLLFSLHGSESITKEEAYEYVSILHEQMKRKINHILDESKDLFSEECIVNIITFGMDSVFHKIVRRKYRKPKKSEGGKNNGIGSVE